MGEGFQTHDIRDFGAGMAEDGFAGEGGPRSAFPSIVAQPKIFPIIVGAQLNCGDTLERGSGVRKTSNERGEMRTISGSFLVASRLVCCDNLRANGSLHVEEN